MQQQQDFLQFALLRLLLLWKSAPMCLCCSFARLPRLMAQLQLIVRLIGCSAKLVFPTEAENCASKCRKFNNKCK